MAVRRVLYLYMALYTLAILVILSVGYLALSGVEYWDGIYRCEPGETYTIEACP